MRDTLYGRVKVLSGLDVSAISTSTNTDGTSINLDQSGQDFRSVMMVLTLGARTDGTYTLTPQESVDGSTWTNIPADRLQGTAALATANAIGAIGVIPDPGTAPYVRIRVVSTTVTTGATGVRGVVLLGQGSKFPVNP